MFAHLHVHTEYSLLDGLGKIKDIVKKVKDSGMTACAITDHGVGYGAVEFYNECMKQGIKPIIGFEAYVAPKSRFDKTGDAKKAYHLVLLVKNETGYKNFCKLISRSNIEGFYYKPRIDYDLLKECHEGLICLSGCVAGELAVNAVKGSKEGMEDVVKRYKDLFGDDYYLEIQNHGLDDEQTVVHGVLDLSKRFGVKYVATNDCHYVNTDDKEAHEWLMCMQMQKKITDENRLVLDGDYSVKTEDEMRRLFPNLQEAFDETMNIVDKCNFDFAFAKTPSDYRMPVVKIPASFGNDYFGYLKSEAYKGLEVRYPKGSKNREKAEERISYELSVIKQMGFAEYFLDTRKTIMWCRERKIPVGPGRGSAAGSVLCYCLFITDIDPIPYNLLFERFLNPERISMPDIDVDYCYSHKDMIIEEEAESNGKDKFCKIQTFGAMHSKSVIRDCCRVAGYPASVGNELSKMVPDELGMTLSKAVELNPEIVSYVKENGLQKVWDIALKIEGLKKSSSTHACGHIPTPVPCEELFPCSVDKETGYLICQYDMVEAEHLGNLKKDLLMLRNLTVIDVTHKLAKKNYGVEVPVWNEEVLNDKAAYDLIASGKTNGIFQLESEGMKGFMKELKPSCFEDVIAGVALYRPGPMDFIPKYIKGKKNPSEIKYDTPELEDILAPTYGCIVYQEQVMQIVQKLAGFSMGRADVVRKAMGKKKMDIMQQERQNFVYGNEELSIPGCIKNGISEKIAMKIYDDMIDFAKYAFNKSHAACYAAIAVQTAYDKAHYPKEFMAGLLSSVMDDTKKLVKYISECRAEKYELLPPDVNMSEESFVTDGNALVYGLNSLKGIGSAVVHEIIEERKNGPYKGLVDFLKRVPDVTNKYAEVLIKSGAFDRLGNTRATYLENAPKIIAANKKEEKNNLEGQLSLFDDNAFSQDCFDTIPEYAQDVLLGFEKDVCGFYLSGHPLNELRKSLERNGFVYACDIDKSSDQCCVREDQSIMVAGMITKVKKIYTKKNDQMAFVTAEDETGEFEVVVFPKVFEVCKKLLKEGEILFFEGKISTNNQNEFSVLADDISSYKDHEKKIWIKNNIKPVLPMSDFKKGKDLLMFYDTVNNTVTKLGELDALNSKDYLVSIFGPGNVAITF